MAAIATSADGNHIFMALEDGSGNQVIVKAARSDLSTWTEVYAPGAGSAANVAMVPSDPDAMLFYGNFGTMWSCSSTPSAPGRRLTLARRALGPKRSTCYPSTRPMLMKL